MWVFEPVIAQYRKTYHILVKMWTDDEPALAGRRDAKIVQTDSPKTFPLDELEDALVEIEYSDNKSKVKRKFVPVGNLVPRGSKTYADHVIYSGKLKGTLVRHMRTEGIFLKVMPKGRKKSIVVSKDVVCPLEQAGL